jgi:Ca2+-binding RTX toxin-like protein
MADRSSPRALRITVVTVLFAAMFVSVNVAAAAPLCALDSFNRALAVSVQPGASVTIAASAPYVTVNGAACALLNDVNAVTVDMAPSPSASLVFDLRAGPLGPGFTDEGNGSSEIEIQVVGMTAATSLFVYGGAGNDGFRVGQFLDTITGLFRGQINMNATLDGATPDVDVSFGGFPGRLVLDGADGNDVLSGAGAGVLFSRTYAAPMFLSDGRGVDQVVGGSGDDRVLTNHEEADKGESFSGGAGTDTYSTGGSYTQSAAIRLDGLANDGLNCPGSACAGNNIAADFEVVDGSPANELIVGDADPEVLIGGSGIDIIKGLGGDDTIRNQDSPRTSGRPNTFFGGPGDDLLYASVGAADTFLGGGGFDTVSFTMLTAGVVVTLDDLPNDGTPGMDADVADDIERIIGTGYADTITGNAADNTILGGPGPDSLFGLGGNDTLLGQGGNDNVNGGGGTDTCAQGGGTGTITGCEA